MPGGNSFERLIKLFSEAALSPNDEKYIMILSILIIHFLYVGLV